MGSRPEFTAYKQIHKSLKDFFAEKVLPCYFTRIENSVAFGLPDIYICLDGVSFWIEVKAPKEPVRKTSKLFASNHPLNQMQKNFFLFHAMAKGKAFILLSTDKRWILLRGAEAEELNTLSVEQIEQRALFISEEKELPPRVFSIILEECRK